MKLNEQEIEIKFPILKNLFREKKKNLLLWAEIILMIICEISRHIIFLYPHQIQYMLRVIEWK